MMIEKIKTHNEVNGFLFSVVEFALIALTIAPFALYYLWHSRVLFGLLALGIVMNALTVVVFGVSSWMARQKDIGVLRWFGREGRATIASRYPDINRDTLILTTAMLIPYIVLLFSLYEQANAHRQTD